MGDQTKLETITPKSPYSATSATDSDRWAKIEVALCRLGQATRALEAIGESHEQEMADALEFVGHGIDAAVLDLKRLLGLKKEATNG